MSTVTLFRPVGAAELALIAESDWRAFPPRLPDQPIFYPVMNANYAEQIAFDLPDDVTNRWPVQIAGGRVHEELWVPAEELGAFNQMIVGPIRLIATYRDGARVKEAQ